MCEYLAGALRSERLATKASRIELREIAKRAGYHIQIDLEIPPSIRTELERYAAGPPGFTLVNITSREGPPWNCIDETLSAELEYSKKASFDEVPFFGFMKSLFRFIKPEISIITYTEGAETGWFPLEKRAASLNEFLNLLYEYRDRPDREIEGVYTIADAG